MRKTLQFWCLFPRPTCSPRSSSWRLSLSRPKWWKKSEGGEFNEKQVIKIPIPSNGNGKFTYIWFFFIVNVGKYAIYGVFGIDHWSATLWYWGSDLEPGMMYFPTTWGANEPQNSQNHRVVRNSIKIIEYFVRADEIDEDLSITSTFEGRMWATEYWGVLKRYLYPSVN